MTNTSSKTPTAFATDTARPRLSVERHNRSENTTVLTPEGKRPCGHPSLSLYAMSDALATAMSGWYGDSKPSHDSIARRQAAEYARLTEKRS